MELDVINKKLLSLQEELLGRVERTHHHLYEREERVSANFSDQSQEMENQALVSALDAEGREELKLIEDALERIASGTFGTCQKCGEEVQAARLDAVPYTRYCISCANQME